MFIYTAFPQDRMNRTCFVCALRQAICVRKAKTTTLCNDRNGQ